MKRTLFLLLSILTVTVFTDIRAQAIPFSFTCITNSDPTDAAIGEAQILVDVLDYGTNGVLFYFTNVGSEACSLTDVYFDDGALLGSALIIDPNSPGVVFSLNASPPNITGHNNITPAFFTTAGFSADSDPPTHSNGVNPGEFLGIYFELQAGNTYADVLNDLETGDLRVGVRLQGFASGGSEAFVNKKAAVPEPSTCIFFLFGIVGIVGIKRKFR